MGLGCRIHGIGSVLKDSADNSVLGLWRFGSMTAWHCFTKVQREQACRPSKRPPEDSLCSHCVVRTGASAFGAKIPCAFQGFVRECLVFKTNFWSLGASMGGPCTLVVKAFRKVNDVEAIRRQTPSEQSAQSTKSVSSDVSCDSTSRQQCVAVN